MKKPKKPPLTIKSIKARNYTPAYEARLIRAVRKARATGKKPTRQAARGHKPKEHVIRKVKEKLRFGGLTADQIKKISAWYEHLFNMRSYHGVPTEDEVIEYAQKEGYKQWTVYRDVWNKVRVRYLAAKEAGTLVAVHGKGGKTYYILGEESGIEPYMRRAGVDDDQWLYYH
mgnify:CR=1 FL=1